MNNITNIPAPRVAFIDERTGMISREWYLFFLNLFTLTGSGASDVTIPDISILLQRAGSLRGGNDGIDGEDGQMGVPGPQGPRGAPGQFMPGMDGADSEDICGAAVSTGIFDPYGAAAAAQAASQPADAQLTTWAGITPGANVATALAVAVGTDGAFVVKGGALGTPSSGTLTSCTGLPAAGLSDYAEFTWTPVPTNLTVVGAPTYSGTGVKIGKFVFINAQISAATSTASTSGSTYFTGFTYTPAQAATLTYTNQNTNDGGVGGVQASTPRLWTPTISTAAGAVATIGASFSI